MSLYSIVEMLSSNHEVTVYCPTSPPDMYNFFLEKGIKVKKISNIGMLSVYSGGPHTYQRTFWKGLLGIVMTKSMIKKIIQKEKPDLVAVNSIVLSWIGRILMKEGVKSICFVRETIRKSPWTIRVKQLLNNTFHGVVYISDFDKRQFGCQKPLTEIVRDCVKLSDYNLSLSRDEACRNLGLDPTKFNVLFVGGISKLKGWNIIKHAMNQLNEDINLLIAGNTDTRERFPSNRFHFLGVRKDMPIIYRASDVLVFPSIAPHQARPVFEAGIMHLPAVISNFKQTSEHIIHMKNGLTFKARSSSDLAEKIKTLYTNDNLRKKLGESNFSFASEFHEFETNKKVLLNFFGKILNSN